MQPWYRQAKATKRGGMGGRKSESLIVPMKQGNSAPRETLWRKGDDLFMEPSKGKTVWDIEPRSGLHVTETDSDIGKTEVSRQRVRDGNDVT